MSDQTDARSAGALLLARRMGEDVPDEQLRAAFKREQDNITAVIDARRTRRAGTPTGTHPIDQIRRDRADRRG